VSESSGIFSVRSHRSSASSFNSSGTAGGSSSDAQFLEARTSAPIPDVSPISAAARAVAPASSLGLLREPFFDEIDVALGRGGRRHVLSHVCGGARADADRSSEMASTRAKVITASKGDVTGGVGTSIRCG
jgi:hypothetical protein